MQRSAAYVLGFAAIVCVVCAVIVSSAAVALHDRQEVNNALYRRKNVLLAAGLATPGESLGRDEVEARFESIDARVVDLRTGEYAPDIDALTFDQQAAATDPETSSRAPSNPAQVQRLPNHAVVYEVRDDAGDLQMVVLPVEGKGLWSTLYGFVALRADLDTIQGLTFYEHGETPGLGGEIDNPRWKSLWEGRKAFDDSGEVAISVIKGPAGPPFEDPYEVDGLAGATMTSRGVTNLLRFWLGDSGFGPYLDRLKGAA